MLFGIVAKSNDNIIGTLDNQLPWRLPEDLKFFKEKTIGHKVVMGRKTYESMGRLLPKRENMIMTRDKEYKVDGAVMVHDIQEVVEMGKHEDLFIIGGAELFKSFKPYIDYFYVTHVDLNIDEGVYLDLEGYELDVKGDRLRSENGIGYCFCIYKNTK